MMVSSQEPIAERRAALQRVPGAPTETRRLVEQLLWEHHAPDSAVDDALLVASELVSNAYRHGSGRIELLLSLFEDRLRIEVVDDGLDQAPAVREQPADETGGWGLRIVDQLTLQWGVFEGTTHMWADIALS